MKLALLALCVGAFLAAPAMAAAATPQGKLTGSATVGGTSFAIGTTVIDGGTSYVGAGNDMSGNCDGDSGTVIDGGTTYNILCAHLVASSGCCNAGSPKMRIAYGPVATALGFSYYSVRRIIDNGASTDTFAGSNGGFASLAWIATAARSIVNVGASGSGNQFSSWTFSGVTAGTFTVTP